jgi:exo-1,4-beta-D-glucosaminidase
MKNIFLVVLIFAFYSSFSQSKTENFDMILHDGWNMQSSVTQNAKGENISQKDFKTTGWYNVSVPTTIIAGLLANHVYNFDPFYAQNFEKLKDERLDKTWWFRKSFQLPASESGKNVVLKLHGINYKANVWLNGKLISDSSQVKGPFRIIELDVTKNINYSGDNVLALEILRPFNPNKRDGDLAIDYADWIHYPPDYNGGIVNNIEIKTYNKVGVQFPFVNTHFDLPSLDVAHLTVYAVATNYTNEPQDAVINGKINDDIDFNQTIHLAPNEKKQIVFSNDEYKQLNIQHPKIWWPWQYGSQDLNRITISAETNGKTSNTISENFGIREITSSFINNASRECKRKTNYAAWRRMVAGYFSAPFIKQR